MHGASLNHVFRLVWSDHLLTWVPVPEGTSGRGKRGRAGTATRVAAAILTLASMSALAGGSSGLPTGAQIVQGSGSISQTANTLTINQATQKLVTNWQSFNIGAGNTVQFNQPSASAVALNRVLGGEVSTIQGALRSNGQVFLLNPNGVLFSSTARVETGGLLASTLSMSDADFMAGRYRLSGDSTASVINEGQILTRNGAGLALVAAKVVNRGELQGDGGTVALVSASDVTLDLGGAVPVQIKRGALDSLIENGGAIRADGGHVILTAQAADALSRSVINQTGVIRARTLSTGARGEIDLLGDMDHGQLNVGGQLDASAPNGGDGGHIETSAAHVDTAVGLSVDAGSRLGQGGTWLIDPYDYTINATAATNIATALNSGTSVTVTTQANNTSYGSTGSGSGDITVASAITKTAGGNATLTLQADRSIYVNSAITSTTGQLGITLSAANNASSSLGGVNVAANLGSNGGRILIGGAGGNQTTAQSYGIGYALNATASTPAVQIGTNVSIQSAGGNITINGRSAATNSGSYSATKGGIYVLSGATVDTGGGMLYMSGISAGSGADKVFGFGVEANSGTVTTFKTSSTTGAIVVDAQNTTNALGALGLVNNGSQARVQFWAPSVAHMLFRINGNNKATTFTQSPPCNPGYPNCGTMVIPGGNQSYTSAGYNVVNMAMTPLYIFSGDASRVYDGTTNATGLPLTSLGGPNGFVMGDLGSVNFTTPSKNVGAYTTLTGAAGNPNTYTSGGTDYAVAYYSQGTYTITQKTINSFSAGNKVYDGTTAASVTGSGIVTGDAVTINATGGFASANVGNNITVNVSGVSLSGADAGNYLVSGGGSISTTANITPAPLTVTASNASKTYNGSTYSGGNGVSYSGFVNSETTSVLGGTLSYSGDSQGAVNAGSYTITPAGLTSSNYTIGYANGVLTVNPATLTLTANTASRQYGSSNPGFSGSVSGLVNGETLANVTTGTLAFSSAATSSSNVGTYAINGSGLSANNGNYTFVQAAGNSAALTITPAPLTVTANNASKTYDGQAWTGGNGVGYSGFVNGDTSSLLTGTLSYSGNSQGAVNAGSYTFTPQGLSAGNYTLSYSGGTLTINPATLTIVANSASRTYGAANPSFGGSVTGFVNGETLASATTGSLAFSTSANTGSGVGSYGLTGSGLSANHGNYSFAQAAGNSSALSVTPAPLTVTANNDSKVYDGNAYSGGHGVSYSGFVNGETSGVLTGNLGYGGTSQGATNAGWYAITPTGLSAVNYALTFANGTLTISPASLTVITGSLTGSTSKVYNASTTASLVSGNFLLSGWVGADGATVTKTTGTYDNANVGTGKTVTVSLSNSDYSPTGGTVLANYQLPTSVSGSIGAITPAPLTLTATANTKTYDGNTTAGATPTVSGLQGSDSVSGLLQAYLNKNAGSGKTVSVTGYTVNDGNSGNNYTVSLVDNTASVVNRASASVSGTAGNLTYNGSTQTQGAATRSGFLVGDDISVSGLASSRNAGTYASNLSVGGNDAGNYDVTVSNANLVIGRAALTLTATANTKTYDGNTTAGTTPTVSGLQGSDSASDLLQAYLNKNAGTGKTVSVTGYTVNDGNSGNNYTVSLVDNTASVVNRASASVSGTASNSTYNGSTQTQGAATRNGFLVGDDISVSGLASGRNAGTYTSNLSVGSNDAGNYDVTVSNANLVIGRAALTLSAGSDSKTYDGTTASSGTPTVSGLLSNDTVTGLSQVYANKNAGTGKTITVGGYTLNDGNQGGNYEVTTVANTSGVITPAPTVTPTPTVTQVLPTVEQFLPKTAPVPNFPDNALHALGPNPQSPGAGNLNYVSLSTSEAPRTTTLQQPGAAPLVSSTSSTSVASASNDTSNSTEGQVGERVSDTGNNRSRLARPGIAGTAVPSANGPLDIYVIDGGINSGTNTRSARAN